MYCWKCGASIDNDSVFCPDCGADQKRDINPTSVDENLSHDESGKNITKNSPRRITGIDVLSWVLVIGFGIYVAICLICIFYLNVQPELNGELDGIIWAGRILPFNAGFGFSAILLIIFIKNLRAENRLSTGAAVLLLLLTIFVWAICCEAALNIIVWLDTNKPSNNDFLLVVIFGLHDTYKNLIEMPLFGSFISYATSFILPFIVSAIINQNRES